MRGDFTAIIMKEKGTKDILTVEEALNEVENFLREDYYTSTAALRHYFARSKNLDEIVAQLAQQGLEEGYGSEIAELDMPPACQRTLLQKIIEIVETASFKFLQKNLEQEVKRVGFVNAGDFEMCADNRDDFLESKKCLRLMHRRSPGAFNEAKYRQLLVDATAVRNLVIHRTWCIVEDISEAARVAIGLLHIFDGGAGESPDEVFLNHVINELGRWKTWYRECKLESSEKLRIVFAEIDDRKAKNRDLPLEYRLPDNVFANDKNTAASKMLVKRRDTRFAMGKAFGEFVCGKSNEPYEKFSFSLPVQNEAIPGEQPIPREQAPEGDAELAPGVRVKRQRYGSDSDVGVERPSKRRKVRNQEDPAPEATVGRFGFVKKITSWFTKSRGPASSRRGSRR